MSRFGADPRSFFEAIYQGDAPWDVGEPQPALRSLMAEYPPTGPVLDLGCGSGDLAIWLAEGGLPVLGIDFSSVAIARAQAKLDVLPASSRELLEFQEANALKPSRLERRFNTVIDSGFLHLFEAEARDELVAELAKVVQPGGRYYLLGFAVEFDVPNTPLAVSEDELRECFSPARGWQVLEIRSAQFMSRVAPPVPALAACVERKPTEVG